MKNIIAGLAVALMSTCAWPGSDAVAHPASAASAASAPVAVAKDPLLGAILKAGSFTSMTLSPDGKRIATLLSDGLDYAVAIIDTETMQMRNIIEPRMIPSDGKYWPHLRSPRFVTWVADDLLAVNYNDGASIVRPDGSWVRGIFVSWRMQIRDANGRNTDWAIVQRDFGQPGHLSRINVRTGENYSVDIDRGKVLQWIADASGNICVAVTMDTAFWSDSTKLTTWMRDSDETPWRKIDERSILDESFTPIRMVERTRHLVVQSRHGGDRLAIWDFDPATRTFGALMAGSADEDVVAAQTGDAQGDVLDVVTDGLRVKRTWFDPRMSHLQASIDASLPDRVNILLAHRESPRMLVYSYSDVDPGRWYLFEPVAMKMKELLAALPHIQPARMQPMRTLQYPSFDGTMVPAYLTLPGKPVGPAPLIVLIHGGPQARDRWSWDRDVQVFASHGYAVFQPQFRGSTGFGAHFEEAGYGQWGQAMQDDITAGVHWLIDQKIADPDRICIVGASYGGYAALWGLEKTPQLYKCGASTAGVVDIGRMLKADSDTNESAVGRELLRSKVADPNRMKVPFDDVSPLRHADRIVAPLLLVHGRLDKRVPISEGEAMRDEMQRLHKDVQWLPFNNEGHGVGHLNNLEAWYTAMLALFERTIGKGTPPIPIPNPVAIAVAPASAPASASSAAIPH